jgi:hypothetical protein
MTDLYQPANADELKSQFLRDVRLAAIDAGVVDPPVNPGSDWDMLGGAVANISLLGFSNIDAAEGDTNVLTATGVPLDDLRKGRGLPEVPATAATGKVVVTVSLGGATIPAARELVYPNGKRCTVDTEHTYSAGESGDYEIDVTATEAGTATNLAGGQIVRFKSAPTNVAENAKVSTAEPLTGGTAAESDERKRARILNDLQNRPAGGNWGQIRQWALDALGSVQDCYVYPALGGPGSAKIVLVKDFDPAALDFSRQLSSTAVAYVRDYIQARLGIPEEQVVQTAENLSVNASVLLTLPDSYLAGGNGLGWTDLAPWPTLEAGDAYRVRVTSCASPYTTMVVTAVTATAPVAGQTHIAWWSIVDKKFYTALVLSSSGGTGAWTLNLDKPLVSSDGNGPIACEYVCPPAHNLSAYGTAWVNLFRKLGPAENTADANRLPRSKRHPFISDEDPCALTATALSTLANSFPEITDYAWGYRSYSTPGIPATVASAPRVFVPAMFAVYPQ